MINSVVNQALFRIFSPIMIGLLGYVLLLLFNNQLEQLKSEFINVELFIFIGISLFIQELNRLIIHSYFDKADDGFTVNRFIFPLIISIVLTIVITTLVIRIYFMLRLGYEPDYNELIYFNIIFIIVALVYFSLYVSFYLLERDYTHSMKNELYRKQEIEADFIQYKNGINPELLFECFESLILLTHKNIDKADEMLSHMSHVYRYILSPKYQEIISLQEEWSYATKLVDLFESLPYRTVNVSHEVDDDIHIVKGTILTILESIIRSIINSQDQALSISLTSDVGFLMFNYEAAPKLNEDIMTDKINILNESYEVYSDQRIVISNSGHKHEIKVPILQLQNQDL